MMMQPDTDRIAGCGRYFFRLIHCYSRAKKGNFYHDDTTTTTATTERQTDTGSKAEFPSSVALVFVVAVVVVVSLW